MTRMYLSLIQSYARVQFHATFLPRKHDRNLTIGVKPPPVPARHPHVCVRVYVKTRACAKVLEGEIINSAAQERAGAQEGFARRNKNFRLGLHMYMHKTCTYVPTGLVRILDWFKKLPFWEGESYSGDWGFWTLAKIVGFH